MRRLILSLFFVTSITLLIACGGGGASGGAGQFAGTYTGTETLTLSGGGVSAPVGTFPLLIVIASVTITDVDGIEYAGELAGNTFSASGVVPISPGGGITCQPATVTYAGSIAGVQITGNIGSNFSCNAPAGALAFTLSGSFSVTRDAAASASIDTDAKQAAIGEAIGSML